MRAYKVHESVKAYYNKMQAYAQLLKPANFVNVKVHQIELIIH